MRKTAYAVVRNIGVGVRKKRREFITLVGSAAVWPWATHAQAPGSSRKIGVIFPRSATNSALNVAGLREGLRQLGYLEGQTIIIDWFFADGEFGQLPAIADRMIRSGAELLVVGGTTPAVIINRSTTARPIVFLGVTDPVGAGLAVSLARAGGNATGLATNNEEAFAKKTLEIFKEILPFAASIVVLINPNNPFNSAFLKEVNNAAEKLGVKIEPVESSNDRELDDALASMGNRPCDGLIVATDPFLAGRVSQVVTAITHLKKPSMFGFREFTIAGGLASYGANLPDMYRRGAVYVDAILKGAKPAELPVELPTKFELVINLRAAKVLGLTVPPSVTIRADELIE